MLILGIAQCAIEIESRGGSVKTEEMVLVLPWKMGEISVSKGRRKGIPIKG